MIAELTSKPKRKTGRPPTAKSRANLVPGGKYRTPNPDPNRNKPTNWNNRHELILYMYAAGQRTSDIAQALNYTQPRVSAIINSPLFQNQYQNLLTELKGKTLEGLIEEIRSDGPKNFRAAVEIRDVFEKNGGDPKVRLAAIRQISKEQDRVWPRKTEHSEEKTIRLVFDQNTIAKMAQALGDAKGIDPIEADFTEIATADGEADLINPKGVDALIEELSARAHEESADS